jgi:transcriptional regulator with XRE-family HTH domain
VATDVQTRQGLMLVVATNIRRRRLVLDLSQAELAGMVGLTRTSVTNIENGRQGMFVWDLANYADALLTTAAWLVTDHGDDGGGRGD